MGYVVAAYTIVWLLMLGYLWSLSRRWESVREELQALRRALAEREEELSARGPGGASGSGPAHQTPVHRTPVHRTGEEL